MMKNDQPELFKQLKITTLTPMLQQYLAIKAEHQEYLLFYRMGDFYELFFDDAIKAAEVLDIVLTSRGKHLEDNIPMCGVPAHAYETYLEKLIKGGFKVAVCEQLETPEEAKKRGYKAVVKRDVVRIITPGTIVEESLLNGKSQNNLVSLFFKEGYIYLACADITTGNLFTIKSQLKNLNYDLNRVNPKEILISERCFNLLSLKNILKDYKQIITVRANVLFDARRAEARIKNFYKLHTLDNLNDLTHELKIAIGSVIEYIEHTHKNNLPRLSKPKMLDQKHFMLIDPSTRANLEIDVSLSGDRKKSLFGTVDKTLTSHGGRLLAMYFTNPLINPQAINKRLDSVEFFLKDNIRLNIRELLKTTPDFERIIGRIFMRKASPRDLGLILNGLINSLKIAEILKAKDTELPGNLKICTSQLGNYGEIIDVLGKALSESLPLKITDGRFIKAGFNAQLDELYNLKDHSNDLMNNLRDKYRKQTGIPNLKITFNKIIGYFVEITPSQVNKIDTGYFQPRQTLGGSIRYTTEELRKIELELLDSNEKITQLEIEIFAELCHKIEKVAENIIAAAISLATIDVASSLAELALQMKYTRPSVDDSNNFLVDGGRHPVVEMNTSGKFKANSCSLSNDNYMWLITGPNMAGKSTYLRQNAILCFMAQIGSFIPAAKAEIGVIDMLFSRVGSADNIAEGNSTFMVEMLETANILNNATAKSFVILDEVGRGTSTHDGLAIAWATLENLHDKIKCRTLFSTHYHELTQLENNLSHLKCYTMRVKEWENKVIFMHEVIKGKADRSYGIHVAEIAGLPEGVLKRAAEILKSLESEKNIKVIENSNPIPNNENSKILNELKNMDLDQLNPKAAYDLLYNLKSQVV